MNDHIITRGPLTVLITHHCPYARRSLDLLVVLETLSGKLLDLPEPIDVSRYALYDEDGSWESSASFVDQTLSDGLAELLTREFAHRLRLDKSLRRWLITVTSPFVFCSMRHFRDPLEPLSPFLQREYH